MRSLQSLKFHKTERQRSCQEPKLKVQIQHQPFEAQKCPIKKKKKKAFGENNGNHIKNSTEITYGFLFVIQMTTFLSTAHLFVKKRAVI